MNALTTGTALVGMIHWTKMMKKHQFSQHVPASQRATGKSENIYIYRFSGILRIYAFFIRGNMLLVSKSSDTLRIHDMYSDKHARYVSI